MKRFPEEFSDLLSPRGRKVLAGKDKELSGALVRVPFFASTELIDAKQAAAGYRILAKAFTEIMIPMERRLPPSNSAQRAGGDSLPTPARQLTTPMGGDATAPAYARATECGLATMMTSASYLAFVQAVAGRPIQGPSTMQVLCSRPGDYIGPHTDHHPDKPDAKNGYTDVHVTFCSPGVKRQLLVYERNGHFATVVPISGTGGVTAYRLPLWHYTTPLEGTKNARRWLVLGTFTDR